MRRARWMMVFAALLPVMASGCGSKLPGQLMLAVQTDMDLPKDIDSIRIEVLRADTGEIRFQNDYFKLGKGEKDAILLPATLAIAAGDDPGEAVKVRVIASHGAEDQTQVKVLREAVTTVPKDRIATLPLSIEFLCDGSAEAERDGMGRVRRDMSGKVIVKNNCPGGLTCVAGTCRTVEVPEQMLLSYQEADVFGGGSGTGDGTCFDVARCFEEAKDVVKLELEAFMDDSSPCLAQAEGSDKINVGLRTEGGGICGKAGCFVALNADDSDTGWQSAPDGKIRLPAGVCKKFKAVGDPRLLGGKFVSVVTAPVGTGMCQQKRPSVPTCGPWSAVGASPMMPDDKQPRVIAAGQSNPLSLFVAGNNVYWTSRGSFDDKGDPQSDGAIKMVSAGGGEPVVIAANRPSPHVLAGDAGTQFLLWTNAADGTIQYAPFFDPMAPPAEAKTLLSGLLQPEGIAAVATGNGLSVYWTELASNSVHHVEAQVGGEGLSTSGKGETITAPMPSAPSPRGIAATKEGACWTYEDKLMSSVGVVTCSFLTKAPISSSERTPRAIATSSDSGGNTTAVYWANFAAKSMGGGIFRAKISSKTSQPVETIAQEDYPSGLVVDGETLYWTSRSGGSVMRLKPGETTPTSIATGQQNPGAIAFSSDAVYWINEGASEVGAATGAIMKVKKGP